MSMIETVTLWNEGVGQLDSGRAEQALSTFSRIKQPSSKIFYNMGCCNCRMGHLQQALQCMTAAIGKDEHLAVAYMYRGTLLHQLNRSSEALSDFTQCLQKLRGKHVVDYGQLGMRYKLFACEPLYNIGVVHAKAGDRASALRYLTEAAESPTETRHASLVNGVCLLEAQNLGQLSLWVLPHGAVFRPPRSKVANLGKKDYLGKAQVVSSNESQTKQPEKLDSTRDKPFMPSPRLLRLPVEGHQKGQRSRSLDRSPPSGGHCSLSSSSQGQRDVPSGTRWLGRPVASSKSQDNVARVTPPISRKFPPPMHSDPELSTRKQPTVLRPAPPPPPIDKQSSRKVAETFGNSGGKDRSPSSQRGISASSIGKKPTPPPKPAVITTQTPTNKQTHSTKNYIQQQHKQVPSRPPNIVPIDKVSRLGSFEQGRPPPPDKVVPRAPVRTIP